MGAAHSSAPFSQRREPALVSAMRQCTLKFSETVSSLPKGSRNDFESTRKPLTTQRNEEQEQEQE